jgi:hypothetical protein
MGECQVCGKETSLVLFSKAFVPTYICSTECLKKYFKPIGGIARQTALTSKESWLD